MLLTQTIVLSLLTKTLSSNQPWQKGDITKHQALGCPESKSKIKPSSIFYQKYWIPFGVIKLTPLFSLEYHHDYPIVIMIQVIITCLLMSVWVWARVCVCVFAEPFHRANEFALEINCNHQLVLFFISKFHYSLLPNLCAHLLISNFLEKYRLKVSYEFFYW